MEDLLLLGQTPQLSRLVGKMSIWLIAGESATSSSLVASVGHRIDQFLYRPLVQH
jgi:hypothetical protein